MSFWEPCFHSLWICPSLCFSGHVICSLAALLFLLLTPLRTLTSCRPHVDLWPISVAFFFFYPLFLCNWCIAFIFILENPTFLSVRSVTDTPHADFSTHWEGGRWPLTLCLSHTVSVCVHHPGLYSSFSLAALLFFFPTLSFPSFPSLFSPSWMTARAPDFHCSSPSVFAWRHWDDGQQ